MEFVLLLVGLVLIIKSADILIDSTSKIARKYGVSTFVIGITVIAFGTSAPELVVGLVSAANGTNQLALGTVIGSSYANMALIVGMSAVIFPLSVKDNAVKREIPMLIFVQGVLAFMILADNKLTRLEGVLLLLGFVGFIVYIIIDAKKNKPPEVSIEGEGEGGTEPDGGDNTVEEDAENKKERSPVLLWILSLLSLIGLYIGGELSVNNSVKIAENLGINETIIGLTIVAVATSLPELVTSLVAVRKREPDIVVGNCVGSNIFNILMVLGVSMVINPFSVQENMTVDALAIILLTILVFIVSFIKKKITRFSGIVLIASYCAYICFKVMTAL